MEAVQAILKRDAVFPNWSQTPIPGVQISASGLLALADLGTIAQRTRIAGGASWLDALLLAPGLHYQQAADELAGRGSDGRGDDGGRRNGGVDTYSAVELYGGRTSTHDIANSATRRYLERVGLPGRTVTVDVGMPPDRSRHWRRRATRRPGAGQRATIWQDQSADLGRLSHLLYLASPVLTVAAFVLMILLQEWWGVASLLALMLSRILNIWVIKQRSQPEPPASQPKPSPPASPTPSSPFPSPKEPEPGNLLTEYIVDLGHGRSVCLRGMAEDLQAITATTWLRAKTHVEGYLEAAAKLTVYMVAAFSGNMTQAGSVVFMVLLLVTAGMLGLSNAHAKTFSMRGRLAAPTVDHLPLRRRGGDGRGDGGGVANGSGVFRRGVVLPYPDSSGGDSTSWPATRASSGLTGLDDFAEKGQMGSAVLHDRYPFEDQGDFN
ncbi:hypothetical protein GGS23DRAFT_186073 [Durotheca rogersii]|uniref:uncharacterized protein n=1 Tax=Durotheca rogersii TaxID=419775 RepID=UPI00221EAB78|nr:uncharacterized protein GGS23DRAFT_186073 [Durotheca rogersii]KAI5867614.1 hypothetical protein GGS23DRAFT_186073 [Durotheca rogersii]